MKTRIANNSHGATRAVVRICAGAFASAAAVAGLFLALSGCGRAEPDPAADLGVATADTDAGFLRALILDDISTRDKPMPSARFVLSSNYDSSTKYGSSRTSKIIDTLSGCKFTVAYTPRLALNSTALSATIPGAPGADQSIFTGDDNRFSLTGGGAQCARLAMRPELVRARDLAASGAREQAVNQAFAQALPSIKSTIEAGANAAPSSRFAMTESVSNAKGGASTDYAMIERSTGCLWRARKDSAGLISLIGIEPTACGMAISMAFLEERKPRASSASSAASATEKAPAAATLAASSAR